MSGEEEGFINRWSRRKQGSAKESSSDSAKIEEQPASSVQNDAAAKTPEEEFDISKLPPVESITAGTDIRAFLSKGVPAALTQAALRRAWSADPAIRDYVGLSEYSWDFNTPGQYGFGELDPSLNVKEMVADVFGKVKEAVQKAETLAENGEPVAPQTESATAQVEPAPSVELRSKQDAAESARHPTDLPNPAETGDKSAQLVAAPQQPEEETETSPLPPRRHGSALPS